MSASARAGPPSVSSCEAMVGPWLPVMAGLSLGALLLCMSLLGRHDSAGAGEQQQQRHDRSAAAAAADSFAELPSRADLEADAEWVDRRYDVGASRQPERLRGLAQSRPPATYVAGGRSS